MNKKCIYLISNSLLQLFYKDEDNEEEIDQSALGYVCVCSRCNNKNTRNCVLFVVVLFIVVSLC